MEKVQNNVVTTTTTKWSKWKYYDKEFIGNVPPDERLLQSKCCIVKSGSQDVMRMFRIAPFGKDVENANEDNRSITTSFNIDFGGAIEANQNFTKLPIVCYKKLISNLLFLLYGCDKPNKTISSRVRMLKVAYKDWCGRESEKIAAVKVEIAKKTNLKQQKRIRKVTLKAKQTNSSPISIPTATDPNLGKDKEEMKEKIINIKKQIIERFDKEKIENDEFLPDAFKNMGFPQLLVFFMNIDTWIRTVWR